MSRFRSVWREHRLTVVLAGLWVFFVVVVLLLTAHEGTWGETALDLARGHVGEVAALIVIVTATRYLPERGSPEAKQPEEVDDDRE